MNISYNWLKEYVDFDLTPQEVSEALTSIGLEVGGVEEIQAVKGGLAGLCVGDGFTTMPRIFMLRNPPLVSVPSLMALQ